LNNVLDGRYHGGAELFATDDAIVLWDEDHDLVEGNTIANVFDAAIEGVHGVTNTIISHNTISNAGVDGAGIGAYFCTKWISNVVGGNVVTASARLFAFVNTTDMDHPCPDDHQEFSNNHLVDNIFRSPSSPPDSIAATAVFDCPPTPTATGVCSPSSVPIPASLVSGNLIQGNDFGMSGVQISPTNGFTNGGSNVCGTGGNLDCNGTGFRAAESDGLRISERRSHLRGPQRGKVPSGPAKTLPVPPVQNGSVRVH